MKNESINSMFTRRIKNAHQILTGSLDVKLTILFMLGLMTVMPEIVLSQTQLPYRNIVTVHSQTGNFLAKSMPYSNREQSCWGRTEVYDTRTSELLYTIPECLTEGYLYLSNDGTTVAHIVNTEYGKDTTQFITKAVSLFRNGKVWMRFNINKLIACDTCDNVLFYYCIDSIIYHPEHPKIYFNPNATERDSLITYNPTFFHNDTVFIYTSNRKLIKLYLPTGEYTYDSFEYPSMAQLLSFPRCNRQVKKFESSYRMNSALVNRGKSLEEPEDMLARKLHMKTGYLEANADRYKFYRIYAWLRVDTAGRASILVLENKDSLPEDKLRKAIEEETYRIPVGLPAEIGCWHQDFHAFLRKSNICIAMMEKRRELQKEREEYEKRLVADTIDGIYIPHDLEDCFHTLDSLLSAKDIRTIKAFKSRDEMGKLHFGLGMWLRNNWGLWGGSRLQKYFFDHGVDHPDYMSGIILEYYYDYLHGEHETWKEFDKTKHRKTNNN